MKSLAPWNSGRAGVSSQDGSRKMAKSECADCGASWHTRCMTIDAPVLHRTKSVNQSIRENLPGVILTQGQGLFYSKFGCHPDSIKGQMILNKQDTRPLLRRLRESEEDQNSMERWAKSGFS